MVSQLNPFVYLRNFLISGRLDQVFSPKFDMAGRFMGCSFKVRLSTPGKMQHSFNVLTNDERMYTEFLSIPENIGKFIYCNTLVYKDGFYILQDLAESPLMAFYVVLQSIFSSEQDLNVLQAFAENFLENFCSRISDQKIIDLKNQNKYNQFIK